MSTSIPSPSGPELYPSLDATYPIVDLSKTFPIQYNEPDSLQPVNQRPPSESQDHSLTPEPDIAYPLVDLSPDSSIPSVHNPILVPPTISPPAPQKQATLHTDALSMPLMPQRLEVAQNPASGSESLDDSTCNVTYPLVDLSSESSTPPLRCGTIPESHLSPESRLSQEIHPPTTPPVYPLCLSPTILSPLQPLKTTPALSKAVPHSVLVEETLDFASSHVDKDQPQPSSPSVFTDNFMNRTALDPIPEKKQLMTSVSQPVAEEESSQPISPSCPDREQPRTGPPAFTDQTPTSQAVPDLSLGGRQPSIAVVLPPVSVEQPFNSVGSVKQNLPPTLSKLNLSGSNTHPTHLPRTPEAMPSQVSSFSSQPQKTTSQKRHTIFKSLASRRSHIPVAAMPPGRTPTQTLPSRFISFTRRHQYLISSFRRWI